MNRRDFLKTAFAGAVAGLVALVLPKGKAEAPPPSMHVRFTESETAWRYISWGPSPEIITVPKGAQIKCHTLGPLFATDEQIADWEAVGWKAWG